MNMSEDKVDFSVSALPVPPAFDDRLIVAQGLGMLTMQSYSDRS